MPKGRGFSFLSTECVCAQAPQAAVVNASASDEAEEAQVQQSGLREEDSSSTAAATAPLDQPAPTS